jgi:hypothetical protein
MKKTFIFITTLIYLTSCDEPIQTKQTNNADYQVQYLFTNDSCNVFKFEDNGNYVYFIDCTGKTVYKQHKTQKQVNTY